MPQLATQRRPYTPAEYFAQEDRSPEKHEYENGEIFAMAGGSFKHSLICLNLNWAIREVTANKDCIGLESNMKVELQRGKQYFYPDLMVVCGAIEFVKNRTDAITNPVVIIEVLSPATETFDRNKKFAAYRMLPSLREYVLVAQDEPQIEAFFRQDDNTWRYSVAHGVDETIRLFSLESDLALRDVYHKVTWESPTEPAQEEEPVRHVERV